MKFDKETLFLEEGDWIFYNGQYGYIKRVWKTEVSTRFELVLREPDRKVWVNDDKDIVLVYPIG